MMIIIMMFLGVLEGASHLILLRNTLIFPSSLLLSRPSFYPLSVGLLTAFIALDLIELRVSVSWYTHVACPFVFNSKMYI